MNQNRVAAARVTFLLAICLALTSSLALAQGIEFQVSPKNLKKAGPILIYAVGLKPGQAVGLRAEMGGVL